MSPQAVAQVAVQWSVVVAGTQLPPRLTLGRRFRRKEQYADMTLTETELVPPLGGVPVTPRQGKKRRLRSPGATTAALLMVGVAILTVILRPSAASSNGAELLLGPALPLAFASLAQMLIILVGDFDLSVGYAVGLANVFSATLLTTNVWLGVLVLFGIVLAYVAMGAIVQIFRVPAIVVTLGASFIWLGIGLTVQPTPGGTSSNRSEERR